MKKSAFGVQLFVALFILLASLSGCGAAPSAPEGNETAPVFEQTGAGAVAFFLEVTNPDGGIDRYAVNTDEETVGAALLKLGMVEGEETEYGLFIKTVNGIEADYDKDKAYWAFYIDGEYAMTGADATAVEAEKTYAFIYTKE